MSHHNNQSQNLVIQREPGPRPEEPTGEPESLVGRLNPRDMGNLAQREKAPVRKHKEKAIISFDQQINENLLYNPKTKENRQVYEKILAIVYGLLQEQSQDVIKSVVDEIIAIMKSERENEKRSEVEALLGRITNELYSDIVIHCKAITDYNYDQEDAKSQIDLPLNLEEEEKSESSYDEMESSDGNSEDEGQGIHIENDGKWLQKELSKVFSDPLQMERQVLTILNLPSTIECENQLVQLFNHDHFDLIKQLVVDRYKIYYNTLLAQAQNEEQREQVYHQMRQTPEGLKILGGNTNGKGMEIEQAILTDIEIQQTPKKIIDLETLVFNGFGHFMSNEKCTLPPNSFKQSKKGYEEIHIPAPKQTISTEPFVQIVDLPAFAQPAFSSFKELNQIQSVVYKTALESNQNLLICAPTGAGKTNIALLTMLQVIGQYYKDGFVDLSKFKIIYIAPMKALVSEMVLSFQDRLKPYKIHVAEVTGDTHLTKHQLNSTQVLIATPEKWDILTRKTNQNEFISLVKLMIIDEIHLLHDTRGPVIEALVSRTIRQVEERQEQVRIVGLSATLPNFADVASFIRAEQSGVFYFNNSYRPVPLVQQYIGITEKKAIRRMLLMNEILYEKVSERAGKSQILVFVHSRKETVKTAKAIREMAFAKDELGKFLREESSSKKILEDVKAKEEIRSVDLKELLDTGIAIHHAGLSRSDRDLVESLFEKKHIQVLVSTSTLAWGVNLPAHTVIIKGTQIYSPDQGRWVELSPQDILQMMGRAGRPKYDTQGEGIILTTYQELKYYLSLLNTQLPIESQFISQLTDQLNAEVSIGTVKNLKDAINWLGYTYLYIRMNRNPTLYGASETDKNLIKHRADLCHSAATLLDKHQLVKYDRKTGHLESTVLGRIACNYYVKYPSMAVYNQHLKPNMGMIDLLKVFSLSEEFKLIPIRDEEKVELAKLMMSVPVPIKGSPDDATTKVNVLLQAYVSRLKLEGFALNSDMVYVTQSAGRIMRAIYEICLKKDWAQSALQCLSFSKMIEKRMWGCMTPLRQFKGLPEDLLRRIEKKEGVTWDHLYNMSTQQLGELIRYQNQATSKLIHNYIHKFPKIDIEAFVQPMTRSCLRIDLLLKCDFKWEEKIHGRKEPFHIFILDCDGEKILYHEEFVMKAKNTQQQFTLTVPLYEIMHPIYFIRVISDKWIACEAERPIPFKNLLLPEPFSRCTELLQLSPLSLDALRVPQIENTIAKRLLPNKQFDQIQTQVFSDVYQSDENFFFGSPCYSSKSIIPHLAILNMLTKQKGFKSVYVSPIQRNCENKFNDFVAIFAKPLSLKVAMLTGQVNTDSKLLETSDIIVSTAVNWDILSRRWRARKGFKDIRLFIADDLHLLGDSGSTLEVVVSRMRMIQPDAQFRVVGLSLSVADYREMAEWLGASKVYNFMPTTRPNNVQLIISSFDQSNRPSRIQQMIKSIKTTLSQDELNIIYVSDRKQARLCALEFMITSEFKIPEQDIIIKEDQYLQHTLQSGIGFLYECMDQSDEQQVLKLIANNKVKVIVITHKLALNYGLIGQVYVLDNQKYDGLQKRYVDYSIAEMLELVETARQTCHILTYAPKKEFYKKFLFEPIPVESQLNHNLSNHLNAEIVAKNIHNTQDCIDWITWSFMYRRLTMNPNYYNLTEITGLAVNNYLSEIIEQTIEELHESKCIAVEEDNELEAINSGIIANYYYIHLQTVRNFTEKIQANSKLKDLLFILAEAKEFEIMNIRNGEETLLQRLQVPYQTGANKLNEPNTKALLLLQSYFSRLKLNADLKSDLQILELAIRLSTAMVDVASSNLWLRPAIYCMNLCQMLVQALWKDEDSTLLQLPFFTREMIQELKQQNIEDYADFINMDEDQRNIFLQRFTQEQVELIAQAGNRIPTIEIKQIIADPNVVQGDLFHVQVLLERQDDIYTDFVIAPHYPKPKEEQWWVFCADKRTNRIFGNKKVGFKDQIKVDLRFQAPEAGDYEMTVFAICDSYVGSDQTKSFKLHVNPIIEEEQ